MRSEIKKSVAKKLVAQRKQILESHQSQTALACYVSPHGHSAANSEHTSALQPWVEKEFLQSDTQVLLLKGAGGSGKSTFNQQLLCTLWQDKVWDEFKPGDLPPRVLAPLWIPLGSHTVDPERLLNYLSQLPESFTEEEINILKSDYRLLLIADGYDEMPGARQINLYDANQLGRYDGRVKLLISARIEEHLGEESTYFVPHQVDGRLVWPLYKERYVAAFNPSQRAEYITQYLAKHKEEKDHPLWPDVATYERHFADIPGIEPLLTTPFVLMMAVETLPSIVAEVDVTLVKDSKESEKKSEIINPVLERLQLTRAKLYDQFMAAWFSRQAEKAIASGQSLKDAKKILGSEIVAEISAQTSTESLAVRLLKRGYAEFCQNLAQHLQTQGRSTLRYPVEEKHKGRVTKKIIEKESPKEQTVQPDSALPLAKLFSKTADRALIRQGCPLRQERSNEYSFLHTSFIDYFVTTLIYQQATKQSEEKAIIGESVLVPSVEKSDDEKEKKIEVVDVEKPKPVHKQGRAGKRTRPSNPLTQRLMTRESTQFLADRVDQDEKFASSLWDWIERSKHDEATQTITAAANAITILNAANKSFSDKDFNGIRIPGANLTGGIFHGTQLKDADLTGINFTDAYLEEVDFSGSLMKDIILNERSVLKGHSLPILCMAYDREHDIAATGGGAKGKDCGIRIWDIKQSQLIDILVGHTDEVLQILFRPGQKELRLISLSKDQTIREWDVKEAKELWRWSSPSLLIRSASISWDGRLLALAREGEKVSEKKDEGSDKTSLWPDLFSKDEALSDNPAMLLALLLQRTRGMGAGLLQTKKPSAIISIYDIDAGALVHSFTPHEGELLSLQWSPLADTRLLVTSSTDRQLKLWDLAHLEKPQLCWQQSAAYSTSLTFLPDGNGILMADPEGVIVRDSKDGARRRLYRPNGLKDSIYSFACDDSGQYISVGDKENIEVMEAQSGHSITVLFGHNAPIYVLAFSSKVTNLLISASHDQTIRLWQTERFLHPTLNQSQHTREITSLLFTSDEKTLISGSLDGSVRFWQPSTGRLLKTLLVSQAGVTALTLAPRGDELIVGDHSGNIHRLSLQTLKKTATLTGQHRDAITCLNVSQGRLLSVPGELQLASGSREGAICLWDLQKNHFIRNLEYKQMASGRILRLWFSEDGQYIYSSDTQGGGRQWLSATGVLRSNVADRYLTGYIAKMPGGKCIVSAHRENHEIRVWDLSKNQLLYTLKENQTEITTLDVSQTGQIISGNVTGNVFLWRSNYALQTRLLLSAPVKQAIISSDHWIYTCSAQDSSLFAYQMSSLDDQKARLAWRQGTRFNARGVQAENVQQLSSVDRETLQLPIIENVLTQDSKKIPRQFNRDTRYALDREGHTPLIRAIQRKDDESVVQLLQMGVYIDQAEFTDLTPLFAAIGNNHLLSVKTLLEYKANVNQSNNKGESPLFTASQQGNEGVLHVLLEHKADVHQNTRNGMSPLYIASQKGYFSIVKKLLDYRSDVNQAMNTRESALYIASQQNHSSVINILLEYKAELNQTDEMGISPLQIASQYGQEASLKILLAHKAEVNHADNKGGSPLLIASDRGQEQAVEILLEHKADINQTSKSGVSPLYIASAKNHESIVKILLAHKAKVNQVDDNGVFPLYMACQEGHERVATTLLEHKADLHQVQKENMSSLSIAAAQGYDSISKFLVEHKADVNHIGKEDAPPLYFASYHGHEAVVKILLEHKAKVNQTTNKGASSLCVASQNNYESVIKMLLEHKADVNQVNEDAESSLFVASLGGYAAVVKTLLIHKALVNKTTAKGWSALHAAACQNQFAIVKLLLNYQADKSLCTTQIFEQFPAGLTAFDIACMAGHIELVALLDIFPLASSSEEKDMAGKIEFQKGASYYWLSRYSQALPHFEKSAQYEYPPAYLYLGLMSKRGLGMVKDESAAERYFHSAGKYEEWFKHQAETGDPESQFHLGRSYELVKKDEKQAVAYYQKAADQGYAFAECRLGVCYEQGIGVAKDNMQALTYYQKAGSQGCASAQYYLGLTYQSETSEVKDDKLGVTYYQKAAALGHADALSTLGCCYNDGKGVIKNEKQAMVYLHQAANRGHAYSQYYLGYCYAEGVGVVKNEKWAVSYYQKAADQGHAESRWQLGIHYEYERGVVKDDRQAVMHYQQAADQGCVEARLSLGMCYEAGIGGLECNLLEAINCYRKAALQGDARAKKRLKELGVDEAKLTAKTELEQVRDQAIASNEQVIITLQETEKTPQEMLGSLEEKDLKKGTKSKGLVATGTPTLTTPLLTSQPHSDYLGTVALRSMPSNPNRFSRWLSLFRQPDTTSVELSTPISETADADFQSLPEEKKPCCRCTIL